jgi:hypothetical protein
LGPLAPSARPLITKAPADPTTTWKFPLADGSLGIKSDHRFSDGTYSVYANGVCGVDGTLFFNGSGDATIQTGGPGTKGCTTADGSGYRKWTWTYPDGYTESATSFMNVRELSNATTTIPVGATVTRAYGMNSGRCQKLQYGVNGNGDVVLVTRVDARTWHVQSQPSPNDNAYCLASGLTYHMSVDFLVISSSNLP